jgi:hypothetical protein
MFSREQSVFLCSTLNKINPDAIIQQMNTTENVGQSTFFEMANTSRQEHCCVSRNIFRRCEACSQAAGQHFMLLLRHKVSLTAAEIGTQNSWPTQPS